MILPAFLLNLVGGRKLVAWIIVGLVAAAIVGGIGYVGHRISSAFADAKQLPLVEAKLKTAEATIKTYEAAVKAANDKVAALAASDAAARTDLAETKAKLEATDRKVSRYWGRIKALEESTDEAGCRIFRISIGYGVCFAAAAAGDPADVAACEAAGSDGAVAPGPGG